MRALQRATRRCAALASARCNVARAWSAAATPLALLCRRGDIAVFDKPAGMLVHPLPADQRGGPDAKRARYATLEAKALLAAAGEACAVHPVSRLDRATSGVLAVALSPHATRALQAVWCNPAVVTKQYVVLVACHPAVDEWMEERPLTARDMRGTIKEYKKRREDQQPAAPAAPNELAPAARHVATPAAPQAARTHFRVLARFPAQDATPQESSGDAAEALRFPTALLCATLHTGRWHQIRRHLSNLGHHVLGDSQHGKLRYNGPARAALGLHRLFLHAASVRIDFGAPAAAAAGLPPGPPLAVVSALPSELADAAARLPGWERAAQVLRAQGLLPEADAGG